MACDLVSRIFFSLRSSCLPTRQFFESPGPF
uniref:Uncharacterized protein n=1 Tax=Anguilla anguilla TaxID=7936 RepID=A0A0E9TMD5_ANGAN